MTPFRLVFQSLKHYWRLNLAVLIGVALTSAILSGALVVGDSVKESLRQNAAARIGKIGPVLVGGERFFTTDLVEAAGGTPLLQVLGTVTTPGGQTRTNGVQIVGVTDDFWNLSPSGSGPATDEMIVNEALARRLEVGVEDSVIVRVEIPGALPKDAPLSGETEQTVPYTGKIGTVASAAEFGLYSLRAEQIPPATVFLPLAKVQELLEKPGRSNVALTVAETAKFFERAEAAWSLDDAGLTLENLGDIRQLSSEQVFIDPRMTKAATAVADEVTVALTYLVNAVRKGDKLTPYSMVAGASGASFLPADLGPREIVVNQWMADDLRLAKGDEVTMEYFVFGDGRKLEEKAEAFTVREILPMDTPDWTRDWTPDFPGLTDAEDVDNWEPGIPLDKSRIRDKDEDYWDQYEATPKAFVTLATAQELWSNRFGDATAVRFSDSLSAADFEARLKKHLTLGDLGIAERNLAKEADQGVAQSFDFGALFASMSFFLIVAALILTALVFIFGVEQRASQVGLLLAMGWRRAKIRRSLMAESVVLAVIGAALGLIGGWIYTRLALWGMSGAWEAAATGIQFVYAVRPTSLVASFAGTILMALGVVWWASRSVMQIQPGELVARGAGNTSVATDRRLLKTKAFWIGLISLVSGLGCLFAPKVPGTIAEQGLFFGAGFLFVAAGVSACAIGLRKLGRGTDTMSSLSALGRRGAVLRMGRSLSVIGLMAAGVFMVTAVNSFRLEGSRGADRRDSGTGGYDYVVQSTLPIYEDLNADEGREKNGLAGIEGNAWEIVSFRVSDGDDASCLNLNRAQRPRLLGVKPERLAEDESFAFKQSLGKLGWSVLSEILPPENGVPVIPGVIDLNTATYALQKKLGDVIEYENDEGERFNVKLVALLDTSILQGSIVVPETDYVKFFPDVRGYRFFLIDGEDATTEKVAQRMTRLLSDRGVETIPAAQRLNEFNAVQNTYLSIFSTLGGLGILLGTVGLAVVVGRNVLERRGQLGLMQAVGFTRDRLGKMVLAEHWFLHVLGVLIGIGAAIVAVLPNLFGAGGLPFGLLAFVNGAVLIGGLIFCSWAAKAVLRGESLIDSLRSE